jgi:hypothetical protein
MTETSLSHTEAELFRQDYRAFTKKLTDHLEQIDQLIKEHSDSDMQFAPQFANKYYEEIITEMVGRPDQPLNVHAPLVAWSLKRQTKRLKRIFRLLDLLSLQKKL